MSIIHIYLNKNIHLKINPHPPSHHHHPTHQPTHLATTINPSSHPPSSTTITPKPTDQTKIQTLQKIETPKPCHQRLSSSQSFFFFSTKPKPHRKLRPKPHKKWSPRRRKHALPKPTVGHSIGGGARVRDLKGGPSSNELHCGFDFLGPRCHRSGRGVISSPFYIDHVSEAGLDRKSVV